MFRDNLNAVIDKNSFPMPDIFRYMQDQGLDEKEMFNTFNMGIGFVLCVNKEDEEEVIKALIEIGERAYKIGHIEDGAGKVVIQ